MLDTQYAHALLHEEEAAWEQVLSDRRLAQSLEVVFLVSAGHPSACRLQLQHQSSVPNLQL